VAEDLHLLAEDLLGESSGDDQHLVADAHADILDVRSGGDGRMGDQRPRRGRPDDERVAGEHRVLGDRVGGWDLRHR
jgi:hypothetical protein